ncbi:acylneuraminate cytidylyltransferase family protein [Akkermansiaceae bacterium]|nr:acylneuraminate cytidylyltransferase family protein [Akkermansiaceae bacterium]
MIEKILLIIPARGGSKGIRDKNIIDVCGKPLIQYSIDPALELKKLGLVSEVIISTNSSKISDLSKQLGAEVPFLRPDNISGDKAKSIEFILHAINCYEEKNVFFDAVLILQPTSPLRDLALLKKAIHLFEENDEDSLISCYKEEYINDLVMYKSGEGEKLKPLNRNHNKGVRRQDHGDAFVRNGSIYITKVSYLRKTKQIISDNPLLVEMRKSQSINVDTMDDLEILKRALCK